MSIYATDETGSLIALDPIATDVIETASQIPPGDIGAAFVKMLVSLAAIVALLFLSYWFLRKLIQNRLQKGSGNAAIQVIEKRMISPKTMLYIVEVDQKRILIAESHLEIKRLNVEESSPQ